jgi:hypothetical protein
MYYDYPMPKLLQEELFSTMRDLPNPWQRDIKVKTEVSHKKESWVFLFILKITMTSIRFQIAGKKRESATQNFCWALAGQISDTCFVEKSFIL